MWQSEETKSARNGIEYLGGLLTWCNDYSQDTKCRIITKATGAMAGFSIIWKRKVMRVEANLETGDTKNVQP